MTNTSEIFPDKMEYGPVVVCSVFAGKNLQTRKRFTGLRNKQKQGQK